MDFENITLQCVDCGIEFEFSANEQMFYQQKGLKNFPKRCKTCRNNRKNLNSNERREPYQRKMYDAICADCGCKTQVPFLPTGDRPVYCRECFNKLKRY